MTLNTAALTLINLVLFDDALIEALKFIRHLQTKAFKLSSWYFCMLLFTLINKCQSLICMTFSLINGFGTISGLVFPPSRCLWTHFGSVTVLIVHELFQYCILHWKSLTRSWDVQFSYHTHTHRITYDCHYFCNRVLMQHKSNTNPDETIKPSESPT